MAPPCALAMARTVATLGTKKTGLIAAAARRTGLSATSALARGAARDPMHDQLKSRRLQQDVVVVAIGLAETEHAGVERSDPIQPCREQDCARP